jgi:hypothetical protein
MIAAISWVVRISMSINLKDIDIANDLEKIRQSQ